MPGLIGEILKGTQALQYHAKTAEVTGKNLAHVNDEAYARQRVLSREGSMYRDIGTLGKKRCEQDAAFRRLDFERCFISFDLTNRFTGIDRIALGLLPGRDLARHRQS